MLKKIGSLARQAAFETACQSFRKRHPEYSTPAGALGNCFGASCEFAEIADDLGLDVTEPGPGDDIYGRGWDLVKVKGIRGHYVVDFAKFKEHWVLRVNGDTIVDCTARQFLDYAPFPLVVLIEQVDFDE
jgi:hypothetical protein